MGRADVKGVNWEADVIAAEPENPAYQAGLQARKDGRERSENPHPCGLDRAQWNKGWDAGGAL